MSVRTLVKSIQNIMRQDTGIDGDAQRISQLCWMFFLKIIDDQDQELVLMRDDYASPIPEAYQWRTWAADPEGITGDALVAFVNDDLFPALKNLSMTGQPGDRRRVVRNVFEDAHNYMKSGQLMRQVVNKINEVDFNDLSERQHFGDIYEQILNDLQSAGNAGEYYTPRAVTAFMADRIDPKPGETLFDPACGTGGFLTCSLRHMRERYVKRPEDEQIMQAALRAVEKKQLPHMLCVTNMLLHGIEDAGFVRHDNTLAHPYVGWEQKDRVDIVLTNPPFGGKEEDGIESNFPQHFRTRETADLFLALIIRLLKPGGRAAVVLPDGSLFGEGVKTRLKEHLMEECNLHTIVRLPNCRAYFDDLWQRGGHDLWRDQAYAWDETVTHHRALGGRSNKQTDLGNFGADAGVIDPPPVQVPAVVADASQALVKLLGEGTNRVPLSFATIEEIERTGRHWAVAYPASKRQRGVQDDATVFIAWLTQDPNDIRVFGRAVGMKHQPGRDDATPAHIALRPWKEKWPRYLRVHHAEFVAGTMGNGASLNELMDTLGANSFAPTQRNAARGQGNTNPRGAYLQQAAVELSTAGSSWLGDRLQAALDARGKVPRETLGRLGWPDPPAAPTSNNGG